MVVLVTIAIFHHQETVNVNVLEIDCLRESIDVCKWVYVGR